MDWTEADVTRVLNYGLSEQVFTRLERLRCILLSNVEQLRVEFLMVGSPADNVVKPHVVFHLNLKPSPLLQGIASCRISMEYLGEGSNGLSGEFHIMGRGYISSSRRATGSFGFNLTGQGKRIKVMDWVNAIRGGYNDPLVNRHDLSGNMMGFNFVETDTDPDVDGCRDWIAQAFTRFYLLDFVNLWGDELGEAPALNQSGFPSYEDFNRSIPRGRFPALNMPDAFWFPDIIDKRFVHGSTISDRILIQSVRMWRGKFDDRAVHRHEKVVFRSETIEYNYILLREQEAWRPPSGPSPPGPGSMPPGGPPGPGSSSAGGGRGSGTPGHSSTRHGQGSGARAPPGGAPGLDRSSAGGGHGSGSPGHSSTRHGQGSGARVHAPPGGALGLDRSSAGGGGGRGTPGHSSTPHGQGSNTRPRPVEAQHQSSSSTKPVCSHTQGVVPSEMQAVLSAKAKAEEAEKNKNKAEEKKKEAKTVKDRVGETKVKNRETETRISHGQSLVAAGGKQNGSGVPCTKNKVR